MIGGWLFARRGWLPIPLLLFLLLFEPRFWPVGLAVVALGEALRLAAVGHIGLPSRTFGADVGPLVDTGPYAWVRNPLYLGNLLMWAGLGIVAWPGVWIVVPILGAYYGAIVRWEESNLASTLGASYREYLARVPRWIPRAPPVRAQGTWSASRALRSERTTLVLLACIFLAFYARAAIAG